MVLKLAQPLLVKNVPRNQEYDTVVFLQKEWEDERLGLAQQLDEIYVPCVDSDRCEGDCMGCEASKEVDRLVVLLRESVKK